MDNNKLDNSISSISTTSTDISTEQKDDHLDDINSKVNTNKLLNKKQQDQRTEKKQTPLEKYLADYEKTLENKSPEDLEKERNELEQQQKMSLIASIILAILALVLLITACIFLPLAPALVIAIPAAIGAITAVASGIIEYNIANKKIDIVNAKKSDLSWRKTTQHIGNNKSKINNLGAGIQQNNSNNKITTTEKNIVNNNSAGKANTKNNTNNIDNNILKDQGNANDKNNINNNLNNNLNIPKNNTSNNNAQSNTNGTPNNLTNNNKNNIIGNNIKNDNSKVNHEKINTNAPIKINIKNTSNNNSDHSTTKACDIDDDNEAADLIYKQTQEQVLNGTLDLYNNRPKNEEEYKKCQDAAKNAETQTERAKNQQQMIKYEIWSQLSQTEQQMYDQRIKKRKTPEKILEENIPDKNKNWQVNLYNKHIENEEKKNQSFFGAIWNVLKFEKTIQEKREAVRTAILKGAQRKNGIQLSDVSKTAGTNYNSGAITNKDKKQTLIKIN